MLASASPSRPGVSLGWERWVGDEGAIVGLDHFGASAPAGTIFEKFGFTVDRVAEVARDVVAGKVRGPIPTLEPGHLPGPARRPPDARRRGSPASIARRARTRATADAASVAFAADHAGCGAQGRADSAGSARPGLGHELIDLGGDGSDPNDDYPDFAQRLGLAIRDGSADRGILICGSGVGASVAANKMRGIRSAVCHDTYSAHQGVEHDDMNVLTLGARVIGPEPAYECSVAFLGATFSGEERHRRRLDKVDAMEAAG